MKYAVTGGAGFIGKNITKKLIENNHQVIVIDNLNTGKKRNLTKFLKDIEFFELDIRDYNQIKKVLKDVDGVFHEAALTIVQESFKKPKEYYDVNVYGTENIFKIAKDYSFKVVYASSSSIYGHVKDIPIKENFGKNPINPYGQTKLEDEILAKKFIVEGVNIIGLRYFNVYGKGQTGSYAGVITKFLNRLTRKKSPIIFGNGKQLRDFVYVGDVAEANLSAMKSSVKNGFFNIGTGKSTSLNSLAKIMTKISKLDLKPIYSESLKGDVLKSQADTRKTEKMLKWKYTTELSKGLKELMQKKSN